MTAITAPDVDRIRFGSVTDGPAADPPTRLGIDGRPVPLMRGRLHEAVIGPWLLVGARWVAATPTPARAAVVVFVLTTTAMFTASAAYHCWTEASARQVTARRLDHAMIHVAIAGTHSAVWPFVAPPAVTVVALVVVWLVALAGAGHALGSVDRRVTRHMDGHVTVSAATGVAVLPWLVTAAAPVTVAFVLAGGAAYLVGAAILGRRAFDVDPLLFGYHESWHVLVVVGVALHALAIVTLAA